MIIDISNKVVVITGASRGLGKMMAMKFAYEGANIVINYHTHSDQAKKMYDELSENKKSCLLVRADVTKIQEVEYMDEQTMQKFGRVDIVINNAGIIDDNLIHQMPDDSWDNVIKTNLYGSFYCSKIFSKNMIANHSGKIINISSIKGQQGSACQTNYSASTAGIIGLTKSLALELGKFNISVNAVCPGFIETDLNSDSIMKKKKAKAQSILNCHSTRMDFINFMTFLISDRVTGISGRVFNLDSRLL